VHVSPPGAPKTRLLSDRHMHVCKDRPNLEPVSDQGIECLAQVASDALAKPCALPEACTGKELTADVDGKPGTAPLLQLYGAWPKKASTGKPKASLQKQAKLALDALRALGFSCDCSSAEQSGKRLRVSRASVKELSAAQQAKLAKEVSSIIDRAITHGMVANLKRELGPRRRPWEESSQEEDEEEDGEWHEYWKGVPLPADNGNDGDEDDAVSEVEQLPPSEVCEVCTSRGNPDELVTCKACGSSYHLQCLRPKRPKMPVALPRVQVGHPVQGRATYACCWKTGAAGAGTADGQIRLKGKYTGQQPRCIGSVQSKQVLAMHGL
jgi:PHD-finger